MAETTIIIEESRSYANGWVTVADNLVNTLVNKIDSIDRDFGLGKSSGLFSKPSINVEAIERIAMADNYNPAGVLYDKVQQADDFLNTSGVGDVDFLAPPAFSADALPDPVQFSAEDYKVDAFAGQVPEVDFGIAPESLRLEMPQKPSNVREVDMPSNLAITLPTAPVLNGDVLLPSPPVISLPTSMANVDWGFVDDIESPEFRFEFRDEKYQSVMLDRLQAKLLADLAFGGYGIETGDEAGLWQRATEREAAEADGQMQSITRDFASRGFLMPPGALFGAIEGIRSKALSNAATLSREVALKRAELYVDNRRFTIQQVKELEGVLLNQHMAIMERVLKSAQISAQFVVDQYRTRLDKARLAVDVVQARVQAFRDLVAAETAKIEIYNAQIKAELAKTEVDKNKLDAYRTQLAGVESVVSVYRLQVQAAEASMQNEKLKVELWRAEVDGYLAMVKAKESEFSGYESRIRGEQAKVQVFAEQVKAHNAKVDAKRIEADIKSLEVKANAEAASMILRAFEAELSANKAANDLISKSEDAAVRALGVKLDAYRTGVDAAGKLTDASLRQADLVTRSKLDAARLMLTQTLEEVNADFKATGFSVSANQKLIDLYKDMIAASLGSLNSIASISE
jgi:hypothetical protein